MSTFSFMSAMDDQLGIQPLLLVIIEKRLDELETLMAVPDRSKTVYVDAEHHTLQSLQNILSDALR